MVKVGTITASYMWESVNYKIDADWDALMLGFKERWTPPRLDALLGRIAAIRMPYVELWKTHTQGSTWDPGMVGALLDKHGLTIASYCVGGVSSDEGLEQDYQFAKALGAPLMSGFLGCKETEELLDAIETYGDKYGVGYAIEPHGTSYSVADPAQLREILDQRTELIGICPDPAWWTNQDFDAIEATKLLKERVTHTHLRCTLQTSGERVAGAEDVLMVLKDSGYQGVYSIEHEPMHDPSPELAEARDFILKVVG
jgi:sugar phosphate isomerase/epimerase